MIIFPVNLSISQKNTFSSIVVFLFLFASCVRSQDIFFVKIYVTLATAGK